MENLNSTFIDYDGSKFLDEFETEEQIDTAVKTDSELDEITVTTGTPHNDTKIAKQDFIDQNRPLETYAQQRLDYLDVDPQRFAENIDQYTQKEVDFLENPSFFYEQALALKDPDINLTDVRIASNNRIAQNVIEKYESQEETGALDAIFDFGSMALHEFVTSPKTLLTEDELEKLGEEVLSAKITKTPREFDEWFNTFAEDYMSKGPRDDSSWRLSQLKEIVNNNGFRPTSSKALTKAFAALDAAGLGVISKNAVKLTVKTAKNKTLVGRVATNEGPENAANVAEDVLNNRLDPEVTSDVGPASLNPHFDEALPSEGSVTSRLLENKLVQNIKFYYDNNAIGRVLPEADVARLAAEAGAKMKKTFGNPIYRGVHGTDQGVFYTDGSLGNYTVTAWFGRKIDGQAFKATSTGKPSQGAKQAAERAQGELIPIKDGDDITGYVIQKRENLNLAKEIPGIDDVFEGAMNLERNAIRTMINDWIAPVTTPIARVFGSASTRGLENTKQLALLGEGAAAAIGKLVKDAARPIEALNNSDRAALAFITRTLRDDPLESARRGWYNTEEFANKYLEFTGRQATPQVRKAYESLVEISDASYLLQSSNIMQRYVQKGYQAIKMPNGFKVPAKALSTNASVPENARILDILDNQTTYKEFLEPKAQVWRLDKEYEGYEYIVRPKSVDSLDPSDVMGYNAGGPRTNPFAKWFVVAGDYNRGRVKTWLSTFTEEDAVKAVSEINTIIANRGKTNIDDIVKQNNSWNPDIETFDDLEKFARENGWDLNTTGTLQPKERNVAIQSLDGDDDAFNGMSFGDFIENDMRRGDNVLPHYGGAKTTNHDPSANIVAGINSAINDFSYRAYTLNAMVSWVKKAKGISGIRLPANIPEDDYYNLFMGAQFTGSGKEVTRMKEIWNIDRRRMNVKRADEIAMRNLGSSVADFVFKGSREIQKIRGKEKPKGVEIDFGDPTNLMLKIGFQTKFGFLNVKQTIVQAFHATSIMMISPTHGPRGAGMALTMRYLYAFPNAIDRSIPTLAQRYNLTEAQIKDIMTYVRSSGRMDLDTEIAELNTGYGRGISGFAGEDYTPSKLANAWANSKKAASKGMEYGLVPFREGDRLARLTGTYTAILEYMAKNPGESILTAKARRQIAARDSALNFHMSSISNASWQKGVLRLPTQWLSHTMRSMEMLFNGKELTVAERFRLGLVLVPMYGASGFGFASAADYIAEKTGMSVDNEFFTFLKWGLIDATTDVMMTDENGRVGTGLTTSFAPAGQIRDTIRKINEGLFLEVVGGPSAQIGSDIVMSLIDTANNLADGNATLVNESTMKTFRNITTLDNIAKMVGIFNNKEYRSKTGATVPGEMTTTEAIMVGAGISPLKVQEFYATKSVIYNDEKKLRKERRAISRLADKAHTMIRSGDPQQYEEGFEILRGLNLRITNSGAPYALQQSMYRSLVKPIDDELPQLILKLSKYDRAKMAERLASTLGN